jgi:hypothetical protein
MIVETFSDGSTIETNATTGCRIVCGPAAHAEYFRRLREEHFTDSTPRAVVAFCANPDGTRKAELIRRVAEGVGYTWEVWSSECSGTAQCGSDEALARRHFRSVALSGTNV